CKQTTPEPPKKKPKPERTLKVACIGDQFMLGEKLDSADRYPAQLQWLLGNDYFVKTFALSKATVLKNGTKPFLKDDLFKQAIDFQPDIIIINLGANDTKMSNWWKYGGDFIGDYTEIVEAFQALSSNPKVMVCRPTKPFEVVSGINDSTMQVGVLPSIDSVAVWRNVEKIDLYSVLEYRRDLFKQYLYPDRTACRVIAEIITDAIISDVEPL
ncbi:MAG: GDSL-type esterase/lipase family protein, partial [Saprospiraceae bacterium]